MQSKILCFVCYYLLKKKKENAFSSDLFVVTDGQIPAVPCSSSRINGGFVHLQGEGVSWVLSSWWVLSLNIPWMAPLVPLMLRFLQSNF